MKVRYPLEFRATLGYHELELSRPHFDMGCPVVLGRCMKCLVIRLYIKALDQ